jgi:hypothetical protein
MVREVVTLVCAVVVVGDVALALPSYTERVFVALDSIDVDGAEIIDAEGVEVAS